MSTRSNVAVLTRLGLQLGIIVLFVQMGAATARGVSIDLGASASVPGGMACVPLSLVLEGVSVFGVSIDVTFNAEEFDIEASADCELSDAGAAADLELECTNRGGNEIRCGLFHLALVELPEGELSRCCFRVSTDANVGQYPLTSRCEAVDRQGDNLSATCKGGGIRIEPPAPVETPTPTGNAGPTPTTTPPTGCPCDCNRDAIVSVAELVVGVRIALGDSSLSECQLADQDGDGQASIGELLNGVHHSLVGCTSPLSDRAE